MREWPRRSRLTGAARRVVVGVAGVVLIVIGVILLAFPGPGTLVALFGVGLLSTEFPWFARLRRRIEALAWRAVTWARARWRAWRGAGEPASDEEPGASAGEPASGADPERTTGRSRDQGA